MNHLKIFSYLFPHLLHIHPIYNLRIWAGEENYPLTPGFDLRADQPVASRYTGPLLQNVVLYVGGSKIFRTGAAICPAVVLAPSTGRW